MTERATVNCISFIMYTSALEKNDSILYQYYMAKVQYKYFMNVSFQFHHPEGLMLSDCFIKSKVFSSQSVVFYSLVESEK